jgi:hypothetical protein
VDNRPDVGDAAIALAAVAYNLARIPAHMAQRLPGMGVLAAEGAAVRARLISRLEGVAADVADRLLAGQLPDTVVRMIVEHEVAERVVAELTATIDVEAAVTVALDGETTQRVVDSVLASPGFDRLLLQATDRVLSGPEVQRVIEHVASSPEVRAALTAQSTTMAEEMVATVRNRAETMDDVAEQKVRGWLRRPRPA